jgi:hypothetical protein
VKFNPRVAICRFAYGGMESSDAVNWAIQTTAYCVKKGINLAHLSYNDTPATLVRNRAIRDCIEGEVDLAIFLDNDLYPDLSNPHEKFFERALDFYIKRYYEAPTVIAAPYCGPPPNEQVYIFRWRNHETGSLTPDFELKMFTREEAAERRGREAVAALPTGLMAIDMRVFTGFDLPNERGETVPVKLPQPYFYYEYEDETQSYKASTEDVTFSRDVALLYQQGGLDTVFVDWECWAGHWKRKLVGRPMKVEIGKLARLIKESVTGAKKEQNANQ